MSARPPLASLVGLLLAVLASACGPTVDQRVTLVSRDGAAAEDGPRLVERLRRAGMKAELGPPTSAATLVLDTVSAPDLGHLLAGFGQPAQVHVHAVRSVVPDRFATREEAKARVGLWSPELNVVPVIAEEPDDKGQIAYRVVFREAGALVDALDVVDAGPDGPDDRGDVRVVFALSEEATKRFETWTGAHIGTQIAIMVDDRVVGLPVIKSAIPGGRLLFFVGDSGKAEQAALDARVLAASILGGPLRGTWTVERVEPIR